MLPFWVSIINSIDNGSFPLLHCLLKILLTLKQGYFLLLLFFYSLFFLGYIIHSLFSPSYSIFFHSFSLILISYFPFYIFALFYMFSFLRFSIFPHSMCFPFSIYFLSFKDVGFFYSKGIDIHFFFSSNAIDACSFYSYDFSVMLLRLCLNFL